MGLIYKSIAISAKDWSRFWQVGSRRKPGMAISAKLRAKVAAVAEELRQELYGADGCPPLDTLFVELEDGAVELGDALTCALMQQLLQAQAEATQREHPEECPCAVCGQPARHRSDPEARWLQTRRGDVGWQEPTYYCDECRQAFFPSVQKAGD
jgi:hypothetical protein